MSEAALLAPSGTLRAAINFGNPVLAQRAPDGTAVGITPALAAELAKRLGVPLALVPFEGAGAVTDALSRDVYDIAFLAVDPVRARELAFTTPYLRIQGGYAVRQDSALQHVDEVDRAGTTIGAALGSAYDLFLTRSLRSATLLRTPSGADALAAYLAGNADVLAGVKQALETIVGANPSLRLLAGHFMSINQAIAAPSTRGVAAISILDDFLQGAAASSIIPRELTEKDAGPG